MAIAAGLIAFTFADPCIAASSAGGMLFLLKAQGQIPGIGIVEQRPGPLVEQGYRVANLHPIVIGTGPSGLCLTEES